MFLIVIVIILIFVALIVVVILIKKSMTERDLIDDEIRVGDEEEAAGWACPKCGTALSEGITYCYECGAEFTEEEAKEAGGIREEDIEDVDEDEIEEDDDEEVEDVDEDEMEE